MYKEDGDDWISYTSMTSHTNTVWDIAWDRSGDRLVSCSEDTSVKIWNSYKAGNKEGIQVGSTFFFITSSSDIMFFSRFLARTRLGNVCQHFLDTIAEQCTVLIGQTWALSQVF